MAQLTESQNSSHPRLRERLFARQAGPTMLSAEKAAIRTLTWRPSAKIHLSACMLCCIRSIDRITVPVGDGYLLERLGLPHLGDGKNRELAQLLRDMP
jgi:hypothetical protein